MGVVDKVEEDSGGEVSEGEDVEETGGESGKVSGELRSGGERGGGNDDDDDKLELGKDDVEPVEGLTTAAANKGKFSNPFE